MSTDENGRPIATIAIPLGAVLTLVAMGIYAGFGWWRAELDGNRREGEARAATNRGNIDAVREELRAHDAKEGHVGVLTRVSGVDRELSALREKLATFDSTVLMRDLERQRRIDVLESVAVKKNAEWMELLGRLVRLETEMQFLTESVPLRRRFTLMPLPDEKD